MAVLRAWLIFIRVRIDDCIVVRRKTYSIDSALDRAIDVVTVVRFASGGWPGLGKVLCLWA